MGDTVKEMPYTDGMDPFDVTQAPMAMTVPQALGRLRVALDDAYSRASRELGLTAQQAELLCAAMRPAAVGDLARVLRCDRSNVTRLVDRAAGRDLFRRRGAEDDGRVTLIELTPTGRQLAERFLARLERQTQEMLARWDEEHRRSATDLLNEIADSLDDAGRGPTG
jgi:DNA-binding MarR family transcriptional regulator